MLIIVNNFYCEYFIWFFVNINFRKYPFSSFFQYLASDRKLIKHKSQFKTVIEKILVS